MHYFFENCVGLERAFLVPERSACTAIFQQRFAAGPREIELPIFSRGLRTSVSFHFAFPWKDSSVRDEANETRTGGNFVLNTDRERNRREIGNDSRVRADNLLYFVAPDRPRVLRSAEELGKVPTSRTPIGRNRLLHRRQINLGLGRRRFVIMPKSVSFLSLHISVKIEWE